MIQRRFRRPGPSRRPTPASLTASKGSALALCRGCAGRTLGEARPPRRRQSASLAQAGRTFPGPSGLAGGLACAPASDVRDQRGRCPRSGSPRSWHWSSLSSERQLSQALMDLKLGQRPSIIHAVFDLPEFRAPSSRSVDLEPVGSSLMPAHGHLRKRHRRPRLRRARAAQAPSPAYARARRCVLPPIRAIAAPDVAKALHPLVNREPKGSGLLLSLVR
jgi:hypothetical protein